MTMANETKNNLPQERSDIIVKIDEGFCVWQFGFNGGDLSIEAIAKAIESGTGTKREYEKMIKGFKL